MDAATVAQLGSGEPTVMHGEAGHGTGDEGGRAGAAKTRIRTRIAHVGSYYRRDGTSVTCELCIADWAVGTLSVPFEFTDLDTGATWKTVAPTLPLRPWSDIREAWVNPFPLAKAPARRPQRRRATPRRRARRSPDLVQTRPGHRTGEAGAQ